MKRFVAMACGALIWSTVAAAETRSFELPVFDEIDVSIAIRAEIVVGGGQSVRVEAASARDLDELAVTVRNGTLVIAPGRGFLESLGRWLGGDGDVAAYITVPELRELGARAGADIRATGMSGRDLTVVVSSGARVLLEALAGDEVTADASSGGSLDAAGTCGRLDAQASSGGALDLLRLECETVRVDASSGGGASVFARDSVEASASSGGGVNVAGGPDEVDIDASVGGWVNVAK